MKETRIHHAARRRGGVAARGARAAAGDAGDWLHVHPDHLRAFLKPVAGFHQGLKETGYVEGRNAAIEYR